MSHRALGVDPGSSATGWALVTAAGSRLQLEGAGVIRPKGDDRATRLADLDRRLSAVVARHEPLSAAVETPFSGRNPRSALTLAEARGVILAALGRAEVPVTSYSPAEVKSAVVGTGAATKQQIVYMVVRLLGLATPPAQDAADAIAIALTHLRLSRWRALR